MMSNAATITGVHAPDRTLNEQFVRELIESGGQMQIMGGQQMDFLQIRSPVVETSRTPEYVHNRTTR